MEYPENCIRGVPNETFIRENFIIGSDLFYFKDRDSQEDGWTDLSINWQDDDLAIEFTMNQKKDGSDELQFKAGVVIVPRDEIDRIKNRYTRMNKLSYERVPLEENKYHGNLLLSNDMVKTPIMKQIAGIIAYYSIYVPRNASI